MMYWLPPISTLLIRSTKYLDSPDPIPNISIT